ncbi:T9SS C-terminal target domain-containing protein, partial [Candidatus Parcubacteria bacterium]
IPNDQGRQVRVTWNSSRFDGIDPEKVIVEYNLWRKAEGAMGKATSVVSSEQLAAQIEAAKAAGGQVVIAGTLWDFVATIPARQFARYAYVAPTLGDATATDTTLSTFMVSAHTADPTVYFDSDPVTGFSIDNLAPAAPANLAAKEVEVNAASAIQLTWDESQDADFAYFALYKDGATEPVVKTIELSYLDTDVAVGESHNYTLTAFDFAGNESEGAEVSLVVTSVAGEPPSAIPKAFALHQNYPNPFNPETVIGFDVPEKSLVRIEIYNILGQKVRTLADRSYAPGTYKVRWDGMDASGRRLPTGVYAYRLRAGQTTITRKMMLIR